MLSKGQLERIDAMLRAGISVKLIAGELGMSQNTLNLRLARQGKQVAKCLEDLPARRLDGEASSSNA